MNTKATILLMLIAFSRAQEPACFPPFANSPPAINAYANLYGGQQDFSLALLNAINKLMPKENLFFSPYSTYHALIIAYFMAGGQTETYLRKVLRLGENQVSFLFKCSSFVVISYFLSTKETSIVPTS